MTGTMFDLRRHRRTIHGWNHGDYADLDLMSSQSSLHITPSGYFRGSEELICEARLPPGRKYWIWKHSYFPMRLDDGPWLLLRSG